MSDAVLIILCETYFALTCSNLFITALDLRSVIIANDGFDVHCPSTRLALIAFALSFTWAAVELLRPTPWRCAPQHDDGTVTPPGGAGVSWLSEHINFYFFGYAFGDLTNLADRVPDLLQEERTARAILSYRQSLARFPHRIFGSNPSLAARVYWHITPRILLCMAWSFLRLACQLQRPILLKVVLDFAERRVKEGPDAAPLHVGFFFA